MTRRRFSKTDWLDHGLRQLSQHGVEALKLDAICESAGRTKGSFYHHFDDHSGFLAALVLQWTELQTTALINAVPDKADPNEKDQLLTDLVMGLDYRLELGIRELGRRDEGAARLISAADDQRIRFLSGIYVEKYGISSTDAQFAARIEYAAYLGIVLLTPDIDRAAQQALADRFQDIMERYFRSPPPSAK